MGDAILDFTAQFKDLGYVTTDDHLMQQLWRTLKLAGRTKGIQGLVLQGPPGTGKTFLGETAAKWWEAALLDIQFTTGVGRDVMMDDVHLANVITAQAGKWDGPFKVTDSLQPGILVQAMEMSQQGRVILLLDELDKAKYQVDAMLLGFLQSGRMNLPGRGEVAANTSNIVVIITMNSERELSEPLMRRLRSVELKWPLFDIEWRLLRREARAFARANKDLIPECYHGDGAPEGMCKAIVTLANKVREASVEASLKKVPSTPELMHAVIDMLVTPDKRRRGVIAMDWLFKYADDYAALVESKKFTQNAEALAAIFNQF